MNMSSYIAPKETREHHASHIAISHSALSYFKVQRALVWCVVQHSAIGSSLSLSVFTPTLEFSFALPISVWNHFWPLQSWIKPNVVLPVSVSIVRARGHFVTAWSCRLAVIDSLDCRLILPEEGLLFSQTLVVFSYRHRWRKVLRPLPGLRHNQSPLLVFR